MGHRRKVKYGGEVFQTVCIVDRDPLINCVAMAICRPNEAEANLDLEFRTGVDAHLEL